MSAQFAKVAGRLDGQLGVAQDDDFEGFKQASGLVEIALMPETLQYFGQNQISDQKRLYAQQFIQPIGLWSDLAAKIVDPDAGIDQNHRSRRIASRSPSHPSRPR